MKYRITIIALSIGMLVAACGDVAVNVDESTYEPKLVLDAYIFPGNPVENIRIFRHYPLNTNLTLADLAVSDAAVFLLNTATGDSYPLVFNPLTFSFGSPDPTLIIDYDTEYQLNVDGTVAGQALSASAIAHTPKAGFQINEAASELGPLKYREKDMQNHEKNFRLNFNVSEGAASYIVSLIALDGSEETFIEDNPYGLELDMILDNGGDLNPFIYQSNWLDIQLAPGQTANMDILWTETWFYGKYRAILYAADINFKHYYLTHGNVQDIDGNLSAPKFYIDGDGIGVFAAAIVDTVYFEILPE